MRIVLSNRLLDNFVLKNQEYLVEKKYYDLQSGQQEYRLYSYLSTLYDNCVILDIGTLWGGSMITMMQHEHPAYFVSTMFKISGAFPY